MVGHEDNFPLSQLLALELSISENVQIFVRFRRYPSANHSATHSTSRTLLELTGQFGMHAPDMRVECPLSVEGTAAYCARRTVWPWLVRPTHIVHIKQVQIEPCGPVEHTLTDVTLGTAAVHIQV